MSNLGISDSTKTEGRRHALLIGVDNYSILHSSYQLYGSVNDALEIRKFLVNQARVPVENVRLLLSPHEHLDGYGPLAARPADAQHIRQAFGELQAAVGQRDHVILFYGGHGIRIQLGDTPQRVYGFAASDLVISLDRKFTNLVLDREINAFLHAIVDAGATVTVLVDTCHSGTTLRGIHSATVRGLPLQRVSADEWEALVTKSPVAQRPASEATQSQSVRGGNGWFEDLNQDWVVLSACHETEGAYEDELDSVTHGLFTACLLRELRKVPADAVKNLRWQDFFDTVCRSVQARQAEQVPVLEGRPEKLVFGGEWQPFDAGFSVTPGSVESEVLLDGGVIDGLTEGAIVGIYPPETAHFADAEAAGVTVIRAEVRLATPTTSRARLLDPTPETVARSRARLLVPAPKTRKLAITLTDVPESIAVAVRNTPGITDFVEFDAPDRLSALEVCPWTDVIPLWRKSSGPSWVGAQGGFVLIPYVRKEPGDKHDIHDDVIAYVPPIEALQRNETEPGAQGHVSPEARLGRAIGEGAMHWARYRSIALLSHEDERLQKLFEVSLRVGVDEKSGKQPSACPVREPSPSGAYELAAGEALWLDVRFDATRPERIFVAIVACSNDGNTMRLWPPMGGDPTFGRIGGDEEEDLSEGQCIFVGRDRFQPSVPTIRPDQSCALYTFKVVVSVVREGEPPPTLAGLLLDRSTQEVIEDVLAPRVRGKMRGDLRGEDEEASLRDAWCVWNLPVCVRRPKNKTGAYS